MRATVNETITPLTVDDIVNPAKPTRRSHTLLTWIAIAAMVVGAGSFLGGIAGASYTWNTAAAQAITTPDDAFFAEVPVRGPLSMWAEQDIITFHQLASTDGLYYAEMDRQIPMVDEAGNIVLDEAGETVMVTNEARASWLNATTLTTSLNLGLMAYALSAFAIVMGAMMGLLGFGTLRLRDE